MGVSEKTAILVISFGTSYAETRKKTIEQIEADLHHAYPEYPIYRAWTSARIRAKLLNRDNIHIMDIDEAIRRIEGIKCGFRPTSCPDQLSKALRQYKESNQN